MQCKQSHELQEFTRLYREFGEIYHVLAMRAGLSDSAFLILYAMFELGEGCLQKEIAVQYSISPQTVSSSIRGLEKKGYLYLKPGKRRDMHIYLTDSGKQLLMKRLYPIVEFENSVFEAMSPKECQELLKLTRKYLDIYHQKLNIVSSED